MSAHVVTRAGYRLEVAPSGLAARLSGPDGTHWLTLRLLAALDRVDAPDETVAVEPVRVDGETIEVVRRSTAWERAGVTLVCRDDRLELRTWVEGRGRLADVHLLAGRSLLPRTLHGYLPSGTGFRTLFSPNPGAPAFRSTEESAVIGVQGDSEPGRQHWFFTPAPLFLAFTTDAVADASGPAGAGWLGLGLAAPVEELGFVQLRYEPVGGRAFGLRLEYEGHTAVDGRFDAPAIVLTPGLADPYEGLRRHRDDLAARGAAPPPTPRETPAWWQEPIFCGWGAQCHLARTGGIAADWATQEAYDGFLAHLEAHDLSPGTITIDDKWQTAYGTNEPDPAKWPDLRGWIDRQHEAGRRVLLWWKAWDAEGLPPELCVRNPDGEGLTLDPSNPAAREELARVVHRMLARDGLDADGLKIDFTARTPSGRALEAHGPEWGIALLHRLLEVVYAAAKRAKPDALVVSHTPHPAFVDVTDMIRLNDMILLDDPSGPPPVVPEMVNRARVVRAACPELLVDTDDWCVPDLATWRAYLDAKLELGVPALYYVSHVDATGEPLTDDDYAALRRAWSDWRARWTAPRG